MREWYACMLSMYFGKFITSSICKITFIRASGARARMHSAWSLKANSRREQGVLSLLLVCQAGFKGIAGAIWLPLFLFSRCFRCVGWYKTLRGRIRENVPSRLSRDPANHLLINQTATTLVNDFRHQNCFARLCTGLRKRSSTSATWRICQTSTVKTFCVFETST